MEYIISLLISYGYWGMLITAFVAGSFFPFSSEAVMTGLLAAALVAVLLPNERLASKGSRLKLGTLTRFHPSVTAMLLIMILFFVYPTNFALTAHDQGLGTLPTTLIMVGLDVIAFIVGLAFGWLMHNLRRQMKYVAPLFFLFGFAALAFVPGVAGMLAGSVLIGLANGAGVPYVNTIASIKGGREAAITVMPLISAALYLGQFLSPLIVSPLANVIGGVNAPYIVAVGIAVLFLLQVYLTRNHHALPPAED